MKKQICLNGFIQNFPSPHSTGLWKHEKSKGHEHNRLSYWVETAQLLEKGKFDAMFIADVLGTYSVYKNSYHPAVEKAVQFPAHDPLLSISAMALTTKKSWLCSNHFNDIFTPLHTSTTIINARSFN